MALLQARIDTKLGEVVVTDFSVVHIVQSYGNRFLGK